MTKVCPICGKEFTPKSKRWPSQTCGRTCGTILSANTQRLKHAWEREYKRPYIEEENRRKAEEKALRRELNKPKRYRLYLSLKKEFEGND